MFNLQTFTSFQGRIPRMTWWLSLLILMILQWVLLMITGGAALMSIDMTDPAAAEQMSGATLPFFIIMLVFLWPSLAIGVKRWHDRDKSGWWMLIALVPLIGLWYIIECGFLRGTEGPNRFGPDPLAEK